MSRQSRDETNADIQEIWHANASANVQGVFTKGDDAYVEDCRRPGTSKKYTYDGTNWGFVERVPTVTVLAYIDSKDKCIVSAIDKLQSGDIRGSAGVLNAWIEIDGAQKEKQAPPPIKTPSVYNAFVSRTLKEVALTRSDISPKDRMRLAMIMWKTYKLTAIQ